MADKNICDVTVLDNIGLNTNAIVENNGTLCKVNLHNEFSELKTDIDEVNTNLSKKLSYVGDYIRTYPTANEGLTTSYTVLDYTGLAALRGSTFQHNSDGTITVLRQCCAIVHASAYFATGFTSGDWICFGIFLNNAVKVRNGDIAPSSSPYRTLTCTYMALLEVGDVISVKALNENGSRGVIGNSHDCSFLCAMALN